MSKHKYPLVRIRSGLAEQLVDYPPDLPAIVNDFIEKQSKLIFEHDLEQIKKANKVRVSRLGRVDAESAINKFTFSGVYFVWHENVLVYIGASKDISKRIRSQDHKDKREKYQDNLLYSAYKTRDWMLLEYFWVLKLAPKDNERTPPFQSPLIRKEMARLINT